MEFRRADHVAWRVVAGETVLIDLRRNVIYGLGVAAGTLWRRLERTATTEQLMQGLPTSDLSHEEQTLSRAQVTTLLCELESCGLVEVLGVGREAGTVDAPEGESREAESAAGGVSEATGVPTAIGWRQDVSSFGACGLFPVGGPTPCGTPQFPS
jgi:hypothetical protein